MLDNISVCVYMVCSILVKLHLLVRSYSCTYNHAHDSLNYLVLLYNVDIFFFQMLSPPPPTKKPTKKQTTNGIITND